MEQNIEQQVTRGLGTQPTQTQKSFQFPTEIISLPSKGLVYPKENPLSSGRVTIKYMTAKEEDILSNQKNIKLKGKLNIPLFCAFYFFKNYVFIYTKQLKLWQKRNMISQRRY